VSLNEERVPFSEREYELRASTVKEFLPSGGTSTLDFSLLYLIANFFQIRPQLSNYKYFSYDAIEIRTTISSPKGVSGGMYVGWYPYHPIETTTYTSYTDPSILLLRKDTVFVSASTSEDVKHTIPWTFPCNMLSCEWLKSLTSESPAANNVPGMPRLVIAKLVLAYVSSVAKGALVRVFMKFKGMKFYGPTYHVNALEGKQYQQMMTGIVGGAAKLAVEAGIAHGVGHIVADVAAGAVEKTADFVCENTGFCPDVKQFTKAFRGIANSAVDNYVNPTHLMAAPFGDTTSSSVTIAPPIFGPSSLPPTPEADEVSLNMMEFLSRPQYVGTATLNGSVTVFKNDPQSPLGTGALPPANWFKFFANLARYWRGTMLFHVVVMGHPMIEVEFTTVIVYESSTASTAPAGDVLNTYSNYVTRFSGTKVITVPMPFLTNSSYLPLAEGFHTTLLYCSGKVLSTMLDMDPTIHYAVFVSAGDDFSYFQPRPPGQYLTANVTSQAAAKATKAKKSRKKDTESRQYQQCRLPSVGAEMHKIDVKLTTDRGTLMPVNEFKELMALYANVLEVNVTDADNLWTYPLVFPNGFRPGTTAPSPALPHDWYARQDYLGYLSSLFLMFRGDMNYKAFVNVITDLGDNRPIAYVSLGDPITSELAYSPWEYSSAYEFGASNYMNFGTGVVSTVTAVQPVMEFCLPLRCALPMSYASRYDSLKGDAFEIRSENALVNTNLFTGAALPEYGIVDLLYRKRGSNFDLFHEVLPPPYSLWGVRGFALSP